MVFVEFVGANERKRWPNIGNGERLLVLLPIYQQTNKPRPRPRPPTPWSLLSMVLSRLEGRRP